jgi:glycosyltransferase involved in cell wall biosynthesis
MSQPHIRLRVLGGGPRLKALRTLADRLGIGEAARFEGRVSFAEVDAALTEAWALVAPSIWAEPLGLVAIEAISRGVPVIASASGGFLETVVDGVSGHLVRTGDELALADSLVSAVDAGPTTVPDDVVEELRQRHDAGEHARRLTEVFQSGIEAHRPLPSAQQAR